MKRSRWYKGWGRFAYLVVAILVLGNGGCLWIAAGAAGGAAAGYFYCKGRVCQAYNANLDYAWTATHTALAELGMPIIKEERQPAGGEIVTRTAEGERVRIDFGLMDSQIAGEGPLTRIGVRVATFGDNLTSERILNQIDAHLTAAPLAGPPASAPAGPPQTAPPPIAPLPTTPPLQVGEPPLLSPQPVGGH